MISRTFCVAAFLVYLTSFTYNILHIIDIDPKTNVRTTVFNYRGYGGKFKFLTFLNFILQTFYYGVCALNAIIGSTKGPEANPQKRSSFQKFRDFLHSTLAFPVGSFVVITFWAIYAVDRELVYPRALDKVIPVWLNHVMHTFVLPILLVDKYLTYHHLPKRKTGLLGLLFFALAYLVWILWIAYYAEIWVYPILRVLETYQRIIFFGFLLMLFISLYLLGESITKFLWRNEMASAMSSKSSSSKKNRNKSKKTH